MIRTVQVTCTLPKGEADTLNAESGRIYSDMLTRHYRLWRKQRVWLSPFNGMRLEDMTGGTTTLHAHSRDAAQEGFYKACKTAKACKAAGIPDVKYPHWQKRWRTTFWKRSGIRLKESALLLARARGLAPVEVALPPNLVSLPTKTFLEARLVWDRAIKSRFLAKQKRRARDLEHKISRAVVTWAKERHVGTLVIGDVRDVADGKHLNTTAQQKIGLWSHGRQRRYITYKAEAASITVTLIDEAYTSQTCPGTLPDGSGCMQCYKPKGRVYRCPVCGFTAHRDGVGCANILSQHYTGEPGHVLPPPPKYRYPFWGKRSPLDTRELAQVPTGGQAAPEKPRPLKGSGVSHTVG